MVIFQYRINNKNAALCPRSSFVESFFSHSLPHLDLTAINSAKVIPPA